MAVAHAVGAHDGPVEILVIVDHHGERAHLHPSDQATDKVGAHVIVFAVHG